MQVLLIIVGIIAGLIVLLLIIALFVKKQCSLYREITINKPQQHVFDFIRYLKNQDLYSVWSMMDPAMKKEYSGTDGTQGFTSSWESNNKKVGKGEQTITNITENERVDLALHFIKPFEGKADAWMLLQTTAPGKTVVQWGLNNKMAYPMNISLLFMNMDKLLGKDLEIGLQNLKIVLENK